MKGRIVTDYRVGCQAGGARSGVVRIPASAQQPAGALELVGEGLLDLGELLRGQADLDVFWVGATAPGGFKGIGAAQFPALPIGAIEGQIDINRLVGLAPRPLLRCGL